jgi:hypothetical protein
MHQHTSTLPLPDKVVKETICLPPLNELQSRLDYNPTTGSLRWKKNNKEAGYYDQRGYRCVIFNRRNYKTHRIVWKMYYGEDPGPMLDHIDRNKSNNAINNLREVDNGQNMHNTGLRHDNKTGQRGVCWANHAKKWMVSCMKDNKRHNLGYYDDLDQAVKVAQDFYERVQ